VAHAWAAGAKWKRAQENGGGAAREEEDGAGPPLSTQYTSHTGIDRELTAFVEVH